MSTYSKQIESWFRTHANPEAAGPMEAYMKHRFPFLGIKTPERTKLEREFWKENGVPAGGELVRTAKELWQLPEREFHYTAMALLEKYGQHAEPEHIDLLESLVTTNSWWDTVDLLAAHHIGFHFTRYLSLIPSYTERWIAADDFWLHRTAILFQLGYKNRTDAELLFGVIRRCAHETEFFIRKAIGWALREYSKTDEAAVRRFVAETPLSPLSAREALKYVDRKKTDDYHDESV